MLKIRRIGRKKKEYSLFNLERILLASFLMSTMRSSSSALVSEREKEQSGRDEPLGDGGCTGPVTRLLKNMNQSFQFQVGNKTSVRAVLGGVIALLCTRHRAVHCLSPAHVLPLNPVYFTVSRDTEDKTTSS